MPVNTYFKPAGVALCNLEEVIINVEELEAIRLKDMVGLEQSEGAEKMRVSRPTFQRILIEARNKIATALIEGKAIRIEGGNFEIICPLYKCEECGFECEVAGTDRGCDKELECPACLRGCLK